MQCLNDLNIKLVTCKERDTEIDQRLILTLQKKKIRIDDSGMEAILDKVPR